MLTCRLAMGYIERRIARRQRRRDIWDRVWPVLILLGLAFCVYEWATMPREAHKVQQSDVPGI